MKKSNSGSARVLAGALVLRFLAIPSTYADGGDDHNRAGLGPSVTFPHVGGNRSGGAI